ncbi:DNA/RNA-binding protein KIN17 [Zootermopsis nevadensis]|uniref:DNA/RNA-binding protein KIN17 n=1 Tax=Zootermopsis nevadensis TaxID=136037 RepID=A0A067R1L9_ZOONE|nr:DNA/RNA-binding protein KIN17 [Zootermopsis nevadensis]
MGKHEVGTPKYIANKIKAKGLQKLRWYCQMCQKQCRDENGFKCHMMSESHQRQLLLFADNADKYIDEFSQEFEDGYLELLKRQFGTKRVHANRVYQDYISQRHHLHMNSTQWETLTDFVKWLGREGKCVVDESEKGWYVHKNKVERRKASALDDIIKYEESKKKRTNRNDFWLVQGIIVKVVELFATLKELDESKFCATIELSSGPLKGRIIDKVEYEDICKVHLQTVIPALGRPVLVVNGAYRGYSATLKELDERKFCVTIEISSGPLKGRIIDKVEYEDICKVHNVDV